MLVGAAGVGDASRALIARDITDAHQPVAIGPAFDPGFDPPVGIT